MIIEKAKKSLGQNFLVDKNITMKIIKTAAIEPTDHVLEIGPGRGALTDLIIERCAKFTAIEADDKLFEFHSKKYSGLDNINIIHGDAVRADFNSLLKDKSDRFKIISNLPYNISGPMLAKIIDNREIISSVTLMLQKEVADRVVASVYCKSKKDNKKPEENKKGKKDKKSYGVQSVIIQNYADVFFEFTVPPTAFRPQPKVTSSIITMNILDGPRFPVADYKFFKKTVKSGFGQRRKTLTNSLKSVGLPSEELLKALTTAKIDPTRRAETLNIEEFTVLSNCLYKRLKNQ